MIPVATMTLAGLASWAVVTMLAAEPLNPELFWGMLGPLVSALVTWAAVVRTYRVAPERVTGVLMAGFGAKLVFFGAYLAVMIRVVELRVVPFAASFVGYIAVLYVLEALFLKRLFAGGMPSAPSA